MNPPFESSIAETAPTTYLVVDSDEEASAVQEQIRDGDPRLVVRVTVRVVRSPQEDAEFRGALGATATVIDLRPLEGVRDDGSEGTT